MIEFPWDSALDLDSFIHSARVRKKVLEEVKAHSKFICRDFDINLKVLLKSLDTIDPVDPPLAQRIYKRIVLDPSTSPIAKIWIGIKKPIPYNVLQRWCFLIAKHIATLGFPNTEAAWQLVESMEKALVVEGKPPTFLDVGDVLINCKDIVSAAEKGLKLSNALSFVTLSTVFTGLRSSDGLCSVIWAYEQLLRSKSSSDVSVSFLVPANLLSSAYVY